MSRLPFAFIVTGMAGFIWFHVASLVTLYEWFQQPLRSPVGWFHAHLFVLGWATMLAMGAVYQLINVILQSEIYSERLGYVHYLFFTIGLSGLLYGFYHGHTQWIAICAMLAFIGILLFSWNMGVTLLRAGKWDAITISAACSVFYLFLTGMTGMVMGLNFVLGLWPTFHDKLFHTHMWLGTIGWFGLLITGFSYKMLPMFYLSHRFSTRLQTITLLFWNTAVIVGLFHFLFGGPAWLLITILLLLTVAIIIYNIHLLQIKEKRHKQNPGTGINWSMYGNHSLGLIAIACVIYAFIFPERITLAHTVTIASWIYIGGWVSFIILCYSSKIVPFLWWTNQYGAKMGQQGTPTMAHMLNENKVNVSLATIVATLILLSIGIVFNMPLFTAISGTLYSIASLFYMTLIGLVFSK